MMSNTIAQFWEKWKQISEKLTWSFACDADLYLNPLIVEIQSLSILKTHIRQEELHLKSGHVQSSILEAGKLIYEKQPTGISAYDVDL